MSDLGLPSSAFALGVAALIGGASPGVGVIELCGGIFLIMRFELTQVLGLSLRIESLMNHTDDNRVTANDKHHIRPDGIYGHQCNSCTLPYFALRSYLSR